jgi:biopolymer transport protein TolR
MAGSLYTRSSTRSRRRGGFKPNSEINVTPLVDVMLVLLIIFMITAPILTVSVPIDLPKPIDREVPKEISPAGNAASPKASRVLTPEQKAKQAEILAKARAARAAKRAQ